MEYIQVITTVATKEDAERIARSLLDAHLAACVQIIGPVTSIYWWQGAVERADEYQCQIKARADHFSQVEEAITRIHPYDMPEVVAMPIPTCNAAYASWLRQELHD
ncbi:MAG: divalent-cation tolerance protein CutA [Desulfobulbaceae bacterium]|nr:MAG: divalent-cation tolerance protein CutA [Desulfobulbaceae bacterium]